MTSARVANRHPARRGARLAAALVVLAMAGCSADDDGAGTTTAPTSSTTTTAPPTTSAPSTTVASTSTTADPQLGCLADALGAHPELLEALGDEEASPADRLRAVLVARTCLPRDQVHAALADGMRAAIPEDLSDYQADCLADLVLDLPDQDLATLLGVEAPAEAGGPTTASSFATHEQIAARLLDLCGVAPS